MSNYVGQNKTGYLYRHVRLDKNEVFYIGIGTDTNYKRANKKLGRNSIWTRIVNKTTYEVEILLDNVNFEELVKKETEFIKIYGKICDKTGTLANLTDGGEGTIGLSFPSNKKGKKLKDIVKDSDKADIIIENSRKPFIVTVFEPEKDSYDIICSMRRDVENILKLKTTSFVKLYKTGEYEIKSIKPNTKHNFKKGTKFKMRYIEIEKKTYKIVNIPIYKKSFKIIVEEPDKEKYEIFFKNRNHCLEVTGLYVSVLRDLKNTGIGHVKHRQNSTKHNFPVGTILNYKNIN